jgi:FlaA1/EpsC-like NDP-sugar epimerase
MLSRNAQVVIDLSVLLGAFLFSWFFRFDFEIPRIYRHQILSQIPLVLGIQVVAAGFAGIYSLIWRYVSLGDVRKFVGAAVGSAIPLLAFRLFLPVSLVEWKVPLSIIFVDTVLAFGGMLGVRILRRGLYEGLERSGRELRGGDRLRVPVLLVGAGQAGVLAAKEIAGRGDLRLDVKGFVDDDPEKLGSVINGVRVLGTTADLGRLVAEHGIDHAIITIARASRGDVKRIVGLCESIPVRARIIPGLYKILDGQVSVSQIRDVEIEDLLGREQVQLDVEGVGRFLSGKSVLVTGAGGSIGSELARQVARFAPREILLVERAEFALFDIDREIRARWPELKVTPIIADIGDEERMVAIFREHRPPVVFHAAAHKHVPLMESNWGEAVKNNILGTKVLGEVAGAYGAEAFVMISTDKAVNPTSVMGASKRVTELVIQCLNRRYDTRFVAVRFGNVLGSTGSVIPIFRDQIRKGGPVTVTDPEMRRYFMTIPEASQLVLQAGALGNGGEIFVLDMGEPVRILDLAHEMIRLSGLKPYEDIDIVVTGLRPGEKLFEELDMEDEKVSRTRHPKIFIGNISPVSEARVKAGVQRLVSLAKAGDEAGVRRAFEELVPEARLTPCATRPLPENVVALRKVAAGAAPGETSKLS